MSVSSIITVLVNGNAAGVKGALAETEAGLTKVGKSGDTFGSKFAKMGKVAAIGIAGIAIAVGAFSVKAGSALDDAQVSLGNALHDTQQTTASFGKGLTPLLSMLEKWGYDNTTVSTSLATLVRAGIPAKKALTDEALAANIARARHIDLATATGLVVKASQGATTMLKRYGIDLGIAAGGALKVKTAHDAIAKAYNAYLIVQAKVKDGTLKGGQAYMALAAASGKVGTAQHAYNVVANAGNNAVAALSKRFAGSASSASKTFQGKVEALKAQTTDLAAKLGQKLIPMLEKLAIDVMSVVMWLTKHKTIAIALGAVIGGVLLAATIAWTVSLFAAGGALAFLISPITLIVAAVAALAFGVYELVTHWSAVWGAITSAVSNAWGVITGALATGWGNVEGFLKTLPGRAVGVLASFGGLLKGWVFDAFKALVAYGPTALGTTIGFFLGLPFRLIGAMLKFDVMLTTWAANAFVSFVHNLPTILKGLFDFFVVLPATLILKLAGFEVKLGAWALAAFVSFAKNLPGYAKNVFSFFAGLPGALIHAVGDMVTKLAPLGVDIVKGIVHGIESMADAIGKAVKNAVNTLPGGSVLSGVLHVAHVPGFAKGGIVNSRTLAYVGEQGAEAIIPLTNPRRASEVMQQAGLASGGASYSRTTHQSFTIVALDVHDAMRKASRESAWAAKTKGD